jgi:hypothetical protein
MDGGQRSSRSGPARFRLRPCREPADTFAPRAGLLAEHACAANAWALNLVCGLLPAT